MFQELWLANVRIHLVNASKNLCSSPGHDAVLQLAEGLKPVAGVVVLHS